MTSGKLPDSTAARCIQLRPRLRRYGVAACKFAECRQDGAALVHYKTRQTQAVACGSLQNCGRVQVTRQYGVRGVLLGVVARSKRAQQIRLIDHTDI